MGKWNKDVIVKMSAPLLCAVCHNKRNKFLKGTTICCLCAEKLSERAKSKKPEMVKTNG